MSLFVSTKYILNKQKFFQNFIAVLFYKSSTPLVVPTPLLNTFNALGMRPEFIFVCFVQLKCSLIFRQNVMSNRKTDISFINGPTLEMFLYEDYLRSSSEMRKGVLLKECFLKKIFAHAQIQLMNYQSQKYSWFE